MTQAAIEALTMRSKLEDTRRQYLDHAEKMQKLADQLGEAVEIKYTGFMALMKKTGTGWECLRIVDTRNLPDEIEDEWDVSLPIPEPESMPEFVGW
jgi:hypothetical protein